MRQPAIILAHRHCNLKKNAKEDARVGGCDKTRGSLSTCLGVEICFQIPRIRL